MFRSNNPVIDTNILAERARIELASARPVVPEQMGEAAHNDAPASSTIVPMKIIRFARVRRWLRRIPFLGSIASWASWIIRVRQIARMAFELEASLSESRRELDHLGPKFRDLEENFEAHLGTFFVASQESRREIDALRAEIKELHAQNESFRQKINSR
jgi:biopolymer transport protein ExbB/TolQ